MAEPSKKPLIRFRIKDATDAPVRTVRGRDAWLLHKLLERGDRGVTPFDEIGPRSSHYAYKLRKAGLVIETIEERHGGVYVGWHGRYILRSPVTVLERRVQ